MRILHVTRELGGDRRFGIGRALGPVVQALQAAGHQATYLTQDALTDADQARRQRWVQRLMTVLRPLAGAPGEVLAHVLGERLLMGDVAQRHAAGLQADVVHLHDPWLGLGFAWAQRRRGGRRRPWGITQHGFGCYTEAIREEGVPTSAALLRWQRRVEARVLQAAGFVCCPTAAARAQLQRDLALPAPPAHWHVLPHALSLQWPAPSRLGTTTWRQALGLPADVPVLLAVGRLNPVKRMDQVVLAAAGLQRRVHLVVLGEGDTAPLQALLPADGRVSLTVQVVADVVPHLLACDVYLSASRNESFGLANLEALACGAPAVCTAVGGVPEVTGGAAWLVPGSDQHLADRLADAVAALLDQPVLRTQWAARGRCHAAAWPDAATVASRHAAIYQTLV